MIATAGLLVVALLLQVPRPDAAVKESDAIRRQERAVLDREAARLRSLADGLASRGEKAGAVEVRCDLPLPTPADGASRFVPRAEVVPARVKGLANVPAGGHAPSPWRTERETIRSETAAELFQLANRASTTSPRHYALADACLRAVIARQPDHPEARRLLGFVPYEGGWATPFAAGQLRDGMALHPTYGWVKSSWVAHLEQGELPTRAGLVRGREVWVAADQADAERGNWDSAWEIDTEHFHIKTNVPLAEAIVFGRHLETFHQLFQSFFADVIGERLPMAQRYKTRSMVGERRDLPHSVSYFATKAQFADFLRPQNPEIDESLGLYLPPKKGRRGHAYFFLDQGGQIAVTATLYHEVSHQLLFESGIAKADEYQQNAGNYWVFEGLGTYFETLTLEPDGSVLIGGRVGPRIEEARKTLVEKGLTIPLARFVRYDKDRFNDRNEIYLHYQQANALTTYLMQARDGEYREGFLDYVKSACQGRLKATTGRSLESRVGKPYAEIEAAYLAYLKGDGPGK